MRKEFSGQLHKFMSCLTETAHHAQGHTVLYLPCEKNLTSPEGIAQAIKVGFRGFGGCAETMLCGVAGRSHYRFLLVVYFVSPFVRWGAQVSGVLIDLFYSYSAAPPLSLGTKVSR